VTSNEIVLRVIEELERLEIPYMLVGSYSSNAFGIARSTQDADFVIEAGDKTLTPLFDALSEIIHFDPHMQLESVTMTLRFIGKVPVTGFKIELFLTSNDPHDQERFRRRKQYAFLTGHAFLPSPEDVLVQKIRWYARAKRPKDLDDIKSVLAVQAGKLDLPYIRQWTDQHGTRELFEKLLIAVQDAI
jgi:hypothetical protein